MIREAGRMEEPLLREPLTQLLATQMRKSYTAWNRAEISNEHIVQDIWDISDGKIQMNPESIQFTEPLKDGSKSSQGHGPKNRKRRLVNSSRK